MSQQDASLFLPFHEDERAAQALAGVGAGAGRAAIRPFMPEQHRDFFALLPCLFTATPDDDGWPIASVLWGDPGFVSSPDPTTLRIAALPPADDPAIRHFVQGSEIGLLGIDLSNRRRNRVNGLIVSVDGGLTVRVRQSFGNCPQYIQTRTPRRRATGPVALEELAALDCSARAAIAAADTLFVASRSRADIRADGGFDMSHRGGRPGFVAAQGDTLVVPDFRGNRYFNTLGNLLGEQRAGLMFVDFASGDILQLQGRVAIDWHPKRAPSGAERLWRVEIERAWRRRGAFPFAWTFGNYAPTTLATGVWPSESGRGSVSPLPHPAG
jgi:predicted pyridoxine 5'-phosphate oxidase superfamily flavin-nucleotide-binding protein